MYPLLALAMACAIAEAGEERTGEALDVKWPNDVVRRGRKLCGVLAESRVSGGAPAPGPPVVIGAGVNVNQSEGDFPPELRERATSLRIVGGGKAIGLDELLAAILRRLERYIGLARGGDPSSLWSEVTTRLPRPGAELSVVSGGRRIDGVLEAITETGALRLRERGRDDVTVVSAGEMA
jgi:BirA family biotin operon repressor/biotin-[acetyl-CoA-carboxylase] ligase